MRIAIYENLPPGGAKRASCQFGRFLSQGHEVDLYRLSITDNRLFDFAPQAHAVYTYSFEPLGGLLNGRLRSGHNAPRSYILFRPLRAVHRRIADDMQKRRYDVVLAHTDAMTQSPYLLRELQTVPTVYYCQEVSRIHEERAGQVAHTRRLLASGFPVGQLRLLEDAIVRPRLAAADRRNAAAATAILVNSRYSRERVWAAYGRTATICYLGVDGRVFRPDPEAQRRREVLSIGSPALSKGHDLIIEALGALSVDQRPSLRVITSAGAEQEGLAELARRRGVALLLEHGLDDEQLAERYRAAQATICAARLEPFGLTALESMACATPVIAIDEAGYRETVQDGTTGVLVEPRAEALAGAVTTLLAQPERAARLGAAGRAWVTAQWTWELAGQRLESALRAAASRPPTN